MLRNMERMNGRRLTRAALLALVPIVAVLVVLVSSAASTTARRLSTRVPAQTRYSLVHGCYALRAGRNGPALASADGPFRMQAAALGIYLLYQPDGDYLTSDGQAGFASDATPSGTDEWQVTGTQRHGFTITDLGTGAHQSVSFLPAAGCAVYPEAGIDAAGRPFTGASAESNVLGTVEGHAHVTALELFGGDWHCGRPWSPFGAPYALPASCAPEEQGTNGEVEAFVDFGGATRPSDMHGWPTFVDWPSPTALAEEGDYYTGIERAWMAGLRVMVTNLVDNEALCSLMTARANPCNDMSSVADPEPRSVRAAELHRRAVRRTGQGLVQDRHEPIPGSAGDQRGQARGDRGDRGVADLRLRRGRAACRSATRARSTRVSRRSATSAFARSSRSTSSTTRSAARR